MATESQAAGSTTSTGGAGTTTPPPDTKGADAGATSILGDTEKVAAQTGGTEGAVPPKPNEGKADEKAGAVAPVDVKVKLPEGVQADAELIKGFETWAKESGLKADVAQKLADTFFTLEKAKAEQAATAAHQKHAEWVQSLKADKDLGGQALPATLQAVRKAVTRFGGDEVKELFNTPMGPGLPPIGSHPALVRFVAKVGRALGEDSVAGTKDGPTDAQTEKQLYRGLYPNTPEFHT